jgi:transglutaminase-like putative cysteine protease
VSWRLAVCHRSGYRYQGDVVSSYNEVRITPSTTTDQIVLNATVDVSPTAHPMRYWDYWGTVVHSFDVHVAHDELVVVGRSTVDTADPFDRTRGLSWADLHDPQIVDDFAELLAPTSYVPYTPELKAVADELSARRSPREAIDAAVWWVRDQLVYEPGATGVHTSATDAWRGGRGVCQDFAHLSLAVLRAMGVPARYVSGYMHPDPEARVGETMIGQSHAWLEAWDGDWVGIDATTGLLVGERHVVVARGRDYNDVSPLKGVYLGGASEALGVSVEITRLR